MKIADAWIADIRGNTWVYLQNIDLFMKGQHTTERPAVSCGAGVGLAAIDIHGDIWPCLRMTKHDRVKWSLGNIYGEFNEELRQRFMDGCPASCIPDECRNCIARCLCGGGCQAENLDCLGDLYTTDPKRCEMARVWTRVGQYARDVLCGEQNRLFLEKYFPQDQRKATPEPSSGPDPAGRASE